MTDDIQKLINDLSKEIRETSEEEGKEEALIRLEEIGKVYNGDDKMISSQELAEIIKTRPPQKKMMTGIAGLDSILDGFREKQLVVLAAPTKSGKTSFAIELTIRMVNENVAWFPFEEPAEELIQKFLDRNEEPPLFFTPQKMLGNTLNWIEKKLIESKAKYGSKVAFIDHLHFIVPFSEERQDLRIGETMRKLKQMAVKWNYTIFLIAHLKKTRLDTTPDLEDLRDSSFIAQEADTVILLWRQTERANNQVVISNNVNVSIQANRRTGKTGNVKLVFENGRFYERDWQHDSFEEKWQ